jgi:hypothetical protein
MLKKKTLHFIKNNRPPCFHYYIAADAAFLLLFEKNIIIQIEEKEIYTDTLKTKESTEFFKSIYESVIVEISISTPNMNPGPHVGPQYGS